MDKNLLLRESPIITIVLSTLSIILSLIFGNYCNQIIFIYILILISLLIFYRNPNRFPDKNTTCGTEYNSYDNLIVMPADGKIVNVLETPTHYTTNIFLRLWDVHVQYAPCIGTVVAIDSSDTNPKLKIYSIDNPSVGIVEMRQAAGLIVRQPTSFVNSGDNLKWGDRMGMIKFGSCVQLTIPKYTLDGKKIKICPCLCEGTKVYGGQTVLALW